MIKIDNVEVFGFEAAIRGMRNPMNSWDNSDSYYGCAEEGYCVGCFNDCELVNQLFRIGDNDLELMHKLCNAGADHRKFMRMINVTMDITAPLYWWKEYDTYKVGTVANSCSTMHKISEKEFTLDDFSHEHLTRKSTEALENLIDVLNLYRNLYVEGTKGSRNGYVTNNALKNAKYFWWQMIQLLPSSYNQKRTVQLNYETIFNMITSRENHKLDEWVRFCEICADNLPYFKDITY